MLSRSVFDSSDSKPGLPVYLLAWCWMCSTQRFQQHLKPCILLLMTCKYPWWIQAGDYCLNIQIILGFSVPSIIWVGAKLMQITSQGAVAMLEYLNHVVILPVCGSWRSVKVKCLLMSERLSCSCNGFEEPVNKKPEYTLPADLPIAIWSEFVDYYQIYSASREDGPFFSG